MSQNGSYRCYQLYIEAKKGASYHDFAIVAVTGPFSLYLKRNCEAAVAASKT